MRYIFNQIRSWFRIFGYIVYNIKHYTKLIIEDRDYDYYFIYNSLEIKLKKTLKHYKKNGFDASSLERTLKVLDRVKQEYYENEILNYYENEYEPLDFQTNTFTLRIKSERFDEYFKKYNIKIDPNWTLEQKHAIINEIAFKKQEKAKKLLFKLMENYINSWWD